MQLDLLQEWLYVHSLQSTLTMCLMLALSYWLARRRPQLAFLLLMVAFVKCLLPPVLASPMPLFSWDSIGGLHAEVPTTPPQVASVPQSAAVGFSQPVHVAQAPRGADFNDSGRVRVRSSDAVTLACLLIWGGGSCLVLLRSRTRMRRVHRLVRSSPAEIPPELQRTFDQLKRELGIRRPVQLRVGAHNAGPFCTGVLRPTLILPSELLQAVPPRLLRPILAHELLHIRRGDVLWGYLQFLVQVIWWFHPLVWWGARRANVLCERCVDDSAIAALRLRPAEYGESLVWVLDLNRRMPLMSAGRAISAAEVTKDRLRNLMRPAQQFQPCASFSCWFMVVVLSGLTLPGVRWQSEPPPAVEVEASLTLPPFDSVRDELLSYLQEQDWEAAYQILAEMNAQQSVDGEAAFWLGYTSGKRGDYPLALKMFRRAVAEKKVTPVALFHASRIYAFLGLHRDALDHLEQALEAGYIGMVGNLDTEPAFANLKTQEKFRELCQRHLQLSIGRPRLVTDVDYWTGRSVVTFEDPLESGNSFSQTFSGPSLVPHEPTLPSETTDVVDLRVSVRPDGRILELNGKISPREFQLITTHSVSDGETSLHRTTLVIEPSGHLQQSIHMSADGGVTWQPIYDRSYVREDLLRPSKDR